MIKHTLTIALANTRRSGPHHGDRQLDKRARHRFHSLRPDRRGGGGEGGGGETEGDTVTRVIPQIAVGSFDGGATDYTTTIQVINASSDAVTLTTAEFFNTDGTDSTVTLTTDNETAPSFAGSVSNVVIAANDSLVLTAASTDAGAVNWGAHNHG